MMGDANSMMGDANSMMGDANAMMGDANSMMGNANSMMGDANAMMGNANSMMGDAALKYMYLPYVDQPVAPTFEGEAFIKFDLGSIKDAGTGLTAADTPITASIVYKKGSMDSTIPLIIEKLEYNDTITAGDYSFVMVKGKFRLSEPFTNIDLDLNDQNKRVKDFSFDRGEFNITCISTNYDTNGYMNYEAYGKFFFYATYDGDDKTLIMDFMNQMPFFVEGLGDSCHKLDADTFHMEGDVFCYPGGYFMGWHNPLLWAGGDQVLYGTDTLKEPLIVNVYSDKPQIGIVNKIYKIENSAGTITEQTSASNSITVNDLPYGTYSGSITALSNDGYVGAVGYKHFKVVMTPFVKDFKFDSISVLDDRTIRIVASCSKGVYPSQYPSGWLHGLKYILDWGDGSTSAGIFTPEMFTGDTVYINGMHTYENPGEYGVKITIPAQSLNGVLSETLTISFDKSIGSGKQQYVGITGVSQITKSQDDNRIRIRADFVDDGPRGTYTAIIDWGDGTLSSGKLIGYNNRLVSEVDYEAYTIGLSGKARGSHVYFNRGEYTIKMTIYKDGEVFGETAIPVSVTNVKEYTGDLSFTGSLSGDTGIKFVSYTIDWGDGSTPVGPVPYSGGVIEESHNFLKGGNFLVNMSFWYSPPDDERRLIKSWIFITTGCVQKEITLSANGDTILCGDIPVSPRDISLSDVFTATVDIPTVVDTDGTLYAIYHWGDDDTISMVTPGQGGIVHLSDTHIYSRPGLFSPRIELYDSTMNIIGTAYSGTLDITPRLAPITATINADQVSASSILPINIEIFENGCNAVWNWGDGASTEGICMADNANDAVIISGSHQYLDPGKYSIRLDIVKDGMILSSAVYNYMEVS
jgi:hypothetical protein